MKKFISIIVMLTLVMALMACGNKDNEQNNESTPTVTAMVTDTPEATQAPEKDPAPAVTEIPAVTDVPTVTETPEPVDVEFIPYVSGSASKYKYDENYFELARVSVPYIHLNDEYKEKYSIIESILNNLTETSSKSVDSFLEQLNKLAEEDINTKDDDTEFKTYFSDILTGIVRSDSMVTSILLCDFSYTGEDGVYTQYNAYNINTKTGGFLSLSDVFTDGAKLRRALSAKIKEEYPDIKFFLLDDTLAASIAEGSLNFIVGYDNVTFYINPGLIAPYENGPIFVSLDFASNSDYIKNVLFNIPEEYSFIPQIGVPFFVDVNDDGAVDKVQIDVGYANEYGEIDKLNFTINGEPVLEQSIYESYEVSPLFVRTKDGKSFIYIATVYLSDDNCIYGFEVNDGKVTGLDIVGEAFSLVTDDLDDMYYRAYCSFIPSKVTLLTRSDLVSTTMVSRTYSVGVDGRFEPIDEFYKFNYRPEITARTEIGIQHIDEAGNVTGEGVLNSGDKITAFRLLEDLSTCDFTMEDGSLVRISFDNDVFGTINDIPVYELFDNVMFAD